MAVNMWNIATYILSDRTGTDKILVLSFASLFEAVSIELAKLVVIFFNWTMIAELVSSLAQIKGAQI
jgi:hypothetical protein